MPDPIDNAQREVQHPHDAEMDDEKRGTRRFPLRLPVSVTAENIAGKEAQTRDVSARGVCFFVDSAIAVGSGLEFTLTAKLSASRVAPRKVRSESLRSLTNTNSFLKLRRS
jgi:hypothetical protein